MIADLSYSRDYVGEAGWYIAFLIMITNGIAWSILFGKIINDLLELKTFKDNVSASRRDQNP
tara:strand:+ start:1002 stop:1187 length:186 start_codon:yes stop_codon:yes gene_type:complete